MRRGETEIWNVLLTVWLVFERVFFVTCAQCRGDTRQHLLGPFPPNCFVTSPADGQKGSALFEWVGVITPYGCRVVSMLSEERRMPHHTERRNSTVLDTGTGRVSGTYTVV